MNERQSDFEWLQQFARAGNQSAFRELVRRHIDLVFATALRKVGDAGGAEEISQNVFGVLARKAWQFAPDDSLPAWLHKTALLESQAWQRGEMRRRRREEAAAELGTTMKTPDELPAFHALVPLLDEALLSLREKDREALLLRYYESQSLSDVGAALNVSDDTAQKRVQSALEKLSQFFQRRGFKTATVAATTAALQQTAASASAATVSLVFNAAIQVAPPALVGLSVLLARFASLTKVQTAAVCVVIAAGPVAWQISEQREAQAALVQAKTQLVAAQNEFSVVQTEVQRLNESATQLEESLARAREAAARSAETAQKFAAWKNSVRARLLAGNYTWPDDLPFVRIPKAILPALNVHQPILPPGAIKPAASELLGLTPQEHEQLESSMQKHFAKMEALLATVRYESNKCALIHMPKDAVAGRVWGVTPAGPEAKASAAELLSTFQTTLGAERWGFVGAQLKGNNSSDSVRRVLNLDAGEEGQELAAWIRKQGGHLEAGLSWGGQGFTLSSGGMELKYLVPDAEQPDGMTPIEGQFNTVSRALMQPALAWLQTQAEALIQQEGTR
jgi:RNA polymerase sigma factor (sigma-70 family)